METERAGALLVGRNSSGGSRVKNVEIYNRVHGSLWIILGGVSMVSLIVNYLTGKAHTGFTVLCGIVVMFLVHQISLLCMTERSK